MALSAKQIARKYEALKRQYQDRDDRMGRVLAVREGRMIEIYPDLFPEGLPAPMIANFVDVVARDLSELLAPLPSFNCPTLEANKQRSKKAADKRTQIANNYIYQSRMETQMYEAADWYLSYAFMPIIVEPDFDSRMPMLRAEDPTGAYPEYDRFGRLVSYSKTYLKTINEILIDYPHLENKIMAGKERELADYEEEVRLVKYYDKDQTTLFMPDRQDVVLERLENRLSRLPVVCARRPGLNRANPRGQFDDVLWVQLARARFSMLALEAVEKSVQAPIVVPNDVDDFAYGPDAIIRTNNPQVVRKVGLELPPGAFTEQQVLSNEMRLGSRYPEGRSGTLDANIITGQGVQALLGSFDTQVKAAQQLFQQVLEEAVGIAFEMDEVYFKGRKTSRGVHNNAPYELTYDPAVDISGDWNVQARYGLMAGLDPSRALIFALQALQAGLVSKDFIMRELPWAMNVSTEQERIDVEGLRDTLTKALAASAQALPQMVATGQGDAAGLVEKIARTIKARTQGKTIEEAVTDIFAPSPAPEVPAGVGAPVEQPSAMGAGQPAPSAPPAPAPPAGQAPPNAAGLLASLMGG
jgi:hypothetical protein